MCVCLFLRLFVCGLFVCSFVRVVCSFCLFVCLLACLFVFVFVRLDVCVCLLACWLVGWWVLFV